MQIKILSEKEFPKIKKVRKKFKITRVLDIKNYGDIEAVELFNHDGIFRGFGRDTKSAFKKAKKVVKNYYSKN